MAWPTKYSHEDIEIMQGMRQKGIPYTHISELLGVPMSSVLFHTRRIKPEMNGSKPEMAKVKDLIAWLQPGVPFTELPLPSGLIAFLREHSERKK